LARCTFWTDETGQDLIEYSLLLAFVALVAVALIMGAGKSVMGAWDEGSEVLASANTSAS
jgi:Flp pilus assembly pilin Flp